MYKIVKKIIAIQRQDTLTQHQQLIRTNTQTMTIELINTLNKLNKLKIPSSSWKYLKKVLQ
jgi:hypothetical protein